MGAIFNPPDMPPPPPPPPPAANPPVYASVQKAAAPRARGRGGNVPGFGDTVRIDAMGGPKPSTATRELIGT